MKRGVFKFAGIGYSLELEKEEIDGNLENYNFVSGFPVASSFKKTKDEGDFFGFVGFSGF